MCGRFRLARKKEILEEEFAAESVGDELAWAAISSPRYNVAPSQQIAVLRQDSTTPRRTLSPMLWGMIPSTISSKPRDAAIGFKTINARSESAASLPAFREPLRTQRCLIPADGFYEWRREGKQKLPFCFTMADNSLFAFAGLWDRWRSPQGQIVESCTILTTKPNELLREIHDRMPVILPRRHYDLWLDPGFHSVTELRPLLAPFPAEQMRRYPVSQRVNNVKYDDAECAEELTTDEPHQPELGF
jgi:putative SOS response-associated peptidase YedK